MYINQIDNLFDSILNKFNIFLEKKKIFERYAEDVNFVKYMNDIIEIIKLFIQEFNIKEIEEIIKSDSHTNFILDIIKRYCAFYIYLGIAYNYKNDRDLYITNIVETSKNIKSTVFSINNFYNSENNAKIIKMFSIIKDILKLKEYKTMERVKIILNNEPLKYEHTISFLNNIGEDYFNDYFMAAEDAFHNILKTLIFKQIYLEEEKNEIIKIINETELQDAEYKYIDIVISNENKLVDFGLLRNVLKSDSQSELFKSDVINDYYQFLEDYKKEKEIHIVGNTKILDFLFSNRIFIPITEEFLRYHKNTERYDRNIGEDIKERDATKIKYIINKMNKVMNLNSSIFDKNQKLKMDALNLFFKPLEYKDAVLYNDLEEVKIISKLELSGTTSDIDYLVDLENLRNYAYINYKDFSRDGFRLRTTLPIQGIRNSNIKYNNPKNRKIELRTGHKDLPLNVIGVIYNPNNILVECIEIEKLKNIRELNKNGYEAMYNLMEKTPDDNLYYWLFDTKLDKAKLTEYKNISSLNNYKIIENMLSELFNHYIEITKNQLYKKINEYKPSSLYEIQKFIYQFNTQYKFTQNIQLKFDHEIISKFFNKQKNIPIKTEFNEEKQIIKIPVSKYIKKKDDIHILGFKEVEIDIENIAQQPICHHYVRWIQLGKISRKKDEELSQSIFDFVKQYVKTNERGEYICKSCSELLDLKKYVYEGTYVAELDTFLTTNLAVNQKLEEIPKYEKYTRTIRNLEKNIEKICYIMNLSYYIGNTPTIKLRRKMIIKDVIDMILIHTDYIKQQPKDRIQKASEIYGVDKDLTNLFFFELKDEIFLTSSADTDYYKLIKYNNIIAYIMVMIIADLNIGQILNLKDDKFCNFFIFNQVKESIFSKLYLRINEKEKISINNIPLLAYVLFYIGCILTNNYVWLWANKDKSQIILVQKIIIHTLVDLINTLIEANMSKDKNYQYELVVNRFMHKVKNVYMDTNAYNQLDIMIKQKISIEDKKYTFKSKNENVIDLKLDNVYNPLINTKKDCISKNDDSLSLILYEKLEYNIDIFTNCYDGKFHEWSFEKGAIICSLCGSNYNDLIKEKNDLQNISRVNQLKLLYLRKLANTYCISGDSHDINIDTHICSKCKKNIETYEYKPAELFLLEKNIRKNQETKAINQLDLIKKYFKKREDKRNHDIKVLVTLNERYNKYTNNKLINYIDDFIDNLIKIVGTKIKITYMVDEKQIHQNVYLKDTLFIIKNDYLGHAITNPIVILSSEDKINYKNDHFYYKRNVLYYHDKIHSAYVYYDAITKNYLGYSKDNKTFVNYKSILSIEIIHGIRDMLLSLGLEHEYYKINHISTKKNKDILKQLIRIRINNLRQIIYRTNSIIEKINNNAKTKEIENPYNIEEFKLVEEFKKSLKHFNTNDKDNKGHIFKHIYTVTNNTILKDLPENLVINNEDNMQIDTKILNKINNTDSVLLFYYIFNLSRLLEYNEQPAIKTNLAYLILKIIQFSYYSYYIPFENTLIRKFDSLLLIDAPYIDESNRVIGFYQELVNVKEIDEEVNKEREMDMNEEQNALDIDEYDDNDVYEDQDPSDDIVDNLLGE